MKQMIRVIGMALFIGLFCSAQAWANFTVEPSIKVNQKQQKTLVVKLNNLELQKTIIKLYDTEGVTLYTEYVKGTKDYAKLFNLKLLPDGKYGMLITIGDEYFEQWVEVEHKNVTVTTDLVKWKKPVIEQTATVIAVKFDNHNKNVSSVTISDKNSNQLHHEQFEKMGQFSKKFDLKHLEDGTYTVKIKIGEHTYYKYITL